MGARDLFEGVVVEVEHLYRGVTKGWGEVEEGAADGRIPRINLALRYAVCI